jgi:succinate dehydrogenase / fumarate reductase membrane anchor subunit
MADVRRAPHIDIMRSPLGRARGLGSARAGSGHWWMQRLTSIALVPLTLWFLACAIGLEGATRADVADWLAHPLPMAASIALVIATFYHLVLGVQVVIEDYVHQDAVRIASLLVLKGVSILVAIACIVAILHLGF